MAKYLIFRRIFFLNKSEGEKKQNNGIEKTFADVKVMLKQNK